jgi:hypothetical protein
VWSGDLHDPFEQAAFAAEGEVDGLRGDVGGVSDRSDGGAGVAALDEQPAGGVENAAAGLFGLGGAQWRVVGPGGLDFFDDSATVSLNSLQSVWSGVGRRVCHGPLAVR